MAGNEEDGFISTSVVAKALEVDRDELFACLSRANLISREPRPPESTTSPRWQLEAAGRDLGGIIREKNGDSWIVWPRAGPGAESLAALIGMAFRIEDVLGRVAAVVKAEAEAPRTKTAKKLAKAAAAQQEKRRSGSGRNAGPFDLRENREAARFCCEDGHYVRSRAELVIDNYLYSHRIVHAYERKVPVEQALYCDFFIPDGSVYLEYWGLEANPEYQARKQQKIAVYRTHELKLIELNDADLEKLDDILPARLRKFGVRVS